MATTAFHPGGYAGRPYGSFAGKADSTTSPHNPGRITALWGYGGPGHLHGSFAGKEVEGATPSVTVKTGTGGIDVKRKRKRGTIKPTGLLDRRVEETKEIAEEIARELKEEFLPQEAPVVAREFPRVDLTGIGAELSARDREIAELLRKKIRTQEEEELICLLLLSML